MTGPVVRVGAVTLLVAGVVAVTLPRVTGAPWRAIGHAWHQLSWPQVALLTVLWFAGLLAHSSVLMAALPGLTRRRALTLNVTGSAVANVLPLGGGVGIGLNYLMARRWGFSARQFSLFTVLSNAWSVLTKAVLPVAAVAVLLVGGVHVGHRLLVSALAASLVLALALTGAAAAAASRRGTCCAGRGLDRLAALVLRRRATGSVEQRLLDLRLTAADLVRHGWRRMTTGMLGYYALCALLLWTCLQLLGAQLSPFTVLAVFAFERLLTVLPLTPGGSGVVELSTTAFALALAGPGGPDQASVVAGVLLYRGFIFGLEIPVGAAWLLGWWLLHRRRPVPPVQPAVATLETNPLGSAA